MIKVGQLRDALRGFNPDWDLVIFDAASIPHPPQIRRPTLLDDRHYRRQGTLEIAPDYVAENRHLVLLRREEFVSWMARSYERQGLSSTTSAFTLAMTTLERYLGHHGIVYGNPNYHWDIRAAFRMVEESAQVQAKG